MAEAPVVVNHERLADFIVSVLEALKMSPKNARLTADLMVRTDLRGADSHGIGMLPKYVEWTQAGFVHPWADPVVARDDLATALVDAQKGLGHPASAMSMELAISKAATTVAVGKLHMASRWNKPVPEGWGLDEHAGPTTDPRKVLASRLLTPLGGSRELGSHKGYGLGVLVDILSGVLGGAVYGDVLDRKGLRGQQLTNTGHCFAAIDIKRFRPVEEFAADMDDMLGALQDMPTADGHERVYTAGQPEAETERHRRINGIPVAPAPAMAPK